MKVTKKPFMGKIYFVLLLILSVSFLLTHCQQEDSTTTTTTPDYIIASSTFPTSGITGQSITGNFTIKNQGTGDGSATVTWSVYQSTDATYDAGDTQVATGIQAFLSSETTSGVIPLSGNWSSTAGTYYLIIRIAASDDTDSNNNETVSSSIVISNPDYTLPSGSLTYPIGGSPGGFYSGSFTITNSGTTTDTIPWTVYLSTDTTVAGAIGTPVTGTTATISPGGTSATQSYTGTWPSTAGTYYVLIVMPTSSGGSTYTTVSAALTIADTTTPTVGGGGTITPSSVGTTSLTLGWTVGSDDTSAAANLTYTVYRNTVSPATGGAAITGPTANITTFNDSGLSPSTTYYYNVVITDEAANTANYTEVSVTTTADTTNPTPGNTGTITAASVTDTSLTLNWTVGSDDTSAVANLTYTVYQSSSNDLSLAQITGATTTGSIITGPTANIATFGVTTLIASTTYYFNVLVTDEAGNQSVYTTLTQATTAPPVLVPDYSPSVTAPASATELTAITGSSFTITNSSADNGVQDITWIAYYNATPDMSGSPTTLNSGTVIGGLNAGATSSAQTITGTWPANGTTYLVVVISATDDTNTANDTAASSAITVDAAVVDYAFQSAVTYTGTDPSNDFLTVIATVENVGTADGTVDVTLNAYASTDGTLDGGDYLLTSGAVGNTVKPIGGAGAAFITTIGDWAAASVPAGTYYVITEIVSSDDSNAANDIDVSTSTYTVAALDTTPPTAGNSGTITSASVLDTTLTLNWTAGSDDTSAATALTYRVFYSLSFNITSVATALANGTEVGSETTNIATKNVTGLSASTFYYFNVIVKDEAGNQTVYTTMAQTTNAPPDTTPPTPGTGPTAASVTDTSLTLNWTVATDNVSAQSALNYKVYYSGSNNISTVADAEANGALHNAGGTTNITTYNVSPLSASSTYYFNVLVTDEAGNKAVYSTLTQATTAAPDTTPPTAGSGPTAASVTDTSLALNWTVGSDDTSAVSALTYTVYQSSNNDLSLAQITGATTTGSIITGPTANIATFGVTTLTASTTYYFNVLITDEAGNQSVYTTLTQATTIAATTLTVDGSAIAGSVPDTATLYYYDFSATSGTDYTVGFEDINNSGYTANTRVTIYNPDASTVATNIEVYLGDFPYSFTASQTGTMLIEVQGYQGAGTFAAQVIAPPATTCGQSNSESEPNNNATSPYFDANDFGTVLGNGGCTVTINGSMEASGNDVYKFNSGSSSSSLDIVITWVSGSDILDYDIYDAAGNPMLYSQSGNANDETTLAFSGLSPYTDYYLVVYAYTGTGEAYTVTFTGN